MKTLIISDNVKFAAFVAGLIENYKNLVSEVVACTLQNGRDNIRVHQPRLVILDIDSQLMNDPAGYLASLMPKYSVPVIVCTEKHNMKYTMVNAGALDVILKPSVNETKEQFERLFFDSITSIKKAVSGNRLRTFYDGAKIIAIGGSTGSTQSLPVILNDLSVDTPPIVCVLHMPEGYTKIYAQQLNSTSPLEIREAENGLYVHSGQVIIAAGSKHLRLFKNKKGYFVTSEPGVRVSGHCPSVDVLFDSVAYAAKSDAIGVILTGMGSDGAKGMLTMRKMGAYNIGQDEASSIVYGMPRAAFENGAVCKQRPLDKIAEEIKMRLKTGK